MGDKREIYSKLKLAKREQRRAAKEMLDQDIAAEKTAAGDAQQALTKAAESGDDDDVKESREDVEVVEKDRDVVKADKQKIKDERKSIRNDKRSVKKVEEKTYYRNRAQLV